MGAGLLRLLGTVSVVVVVTFDWLIILKWTNDVDGFVNTETCDDWLCECSLAAGGSVGVIATVAEVSADLW